MNIIHKAYYYTLILITRVLLKLQGASKAKKMLYIFSLRHKIMVTVYILKKGNI